VNAAEGLGVTAEALSELVNGQTDISRYMAIRLAEAFPNTDIRFWFDLQLQYDNWQAETTRHSGTVILSIGNRLGALQTPLGGIDNAVALPGHRGSGHVRERNRGVAKPGDLAR
jgi:addiction module HigA family antidote